MNDFQPEFSQPFVFKIPADGADSIGVDLKWLGEESTHITELFNRFVNEYSKNVSSGNHPPELLKQQFKIIEALSAYQIALSEHQKKRQGYIQSESDVQEMMNQLENFVKMFREGK
ncbi:MAG: hypothetical protein SFU25_00910 [Candidatus Caenarcaniphilales bacterium]|nr:hypothetical protein [Candidatus Caenarcaniphilales bacterium]